MTYPVRIRGVDYASPREAADALGIPIGTVHSGLTRGDPDSIGTGPKRQIPRPVEIGTFSAPSVREASRMLGCAHTTIRRKLAEGDAEWFEARANSC